MTVAVKTFDVPTTIEAVAGATVTTTPSMMVTVAVELVTAQQGLGTVIWLAWQTLRTEEMYATLVVIALLGLASNYILNSIARRLMPWQRKNEQI